MIIFWNVVQRMASAKKKWEYPISPEVDCAHVNSASSFIAEVEHFIYECCTGEGLKVYPN